MPLEGFSIKELKTVISESGAGWQAGENLLTEMSSEERALHLGFVPGPEDLSLEEREITAKANFEASLSASAKAVGYPASFDLRNVSGQNFITSVKDQGGCGSCVAFGTLATAEGALRWQRGNPNLNIDLSEAQLFYCWARAEGRNCGNGWWPDNALNALRDKGVADEACYPYKAGDQNCTNLCSDWQSRATRISGWHKITSVQDMKTWLSTRGPLDGCFTVYQDFFAYKSGIYKHVTGGIAGGHCISIVGYNDVDKYWICKNSWGSGWGDGGFFKIAYGECGIDATMWAIDEVAETGWIRDCRIIGLWAINQDRNAWVYVNNLGWRRICFDNDNIFLDMLAQLIAAKAASRRVDFRQENAVIKEIYVF